MKLAEALIERSDLQKKLGELRVRIVAALYKAEDDEVENAVELLAEADKVVDRLEGLIVRINETNMSTQFKAENVDGVLMDALARRDALTSKHTTLKQVLEGTSRRRGYFDDRVPQGKLMVPLSDLRANADRIAGEIRRLDLAIQQTNWDTDLK